ncbi:uncharacterized protein PITG_10456 [Phytophthora infestans T30-4]|uniref:Uncharacterized protein n=1 Tax=Phytophthora infestans (strain T30-4) TaxID=403677 RepID=D0NFC7_PHYIT|nr:uncharacterized protein PITG_10456 [Phytophthora infestans T30-4]EEY56916.1 hypothetical protein PITG_10456 [Phytophthora infestans T30-4]KAI9992182.1 hypothetical protein PInf_017567 [Phytophthora infestans]|eukprot:XP_002902244.1 hypothetical protein PITG_10456 [Phytophthora infestans T30-4]
MAVVLTLKVHEPFGNSKTGYGTPHTMELVLSDGYLGFRARLQRIDTLQREADSATQAISNSREFITIQFRISGVVVPLEVNASDMREGFDLPDYDLRPPYD